MGIGATPGLLAAGWPGRAPGQVRPRLSLTHGARPGESLRIKLKVSSTNAAAWRRAGKLSVTFTITLTVPGGTPVTVAKTVKLRTPRRT